MPVKVDLLMVKSEKLLNAGWCHISFIRHGDEDKIQVLNTLGIFYPTSRSDVFQQQILMRILLGLINWDCFGLLKWFLTNPTLLGIV